jgi:hypothetical protein
MATMALPSGVRGPVLHPAWKRHSQRPELFALRTIFEPHGSPRLLRASQKPIPIAI